MLQNKCLKSVFIAIGIFFYNSVLQADNSATTLNESVSNARFVSLIKTENQPNTSTIFDDNAKLNVSFEISVAPEHIGQLGNIYIVAIYEGRLYMKSVQGWRTWDVSKEELVPNNGIPQVLNQKETILVENELSGLLGSFKVYVGYKVSNQGAGNIQHNASPLSFSVIDFGSSNCLATLASFKVLSVKETGALGNGKANDTAAIQAAIDQTAGSGGTVLIPQGTYMVDAVKHLKLKSNMTFRMLDNAVIKAMANNKADYGVLNIENASNINIIGGTIQGERNEHQGTTGEWGHGVEIYASSDVVVEKVVSKDNWGDGFYVGRNSKNVTFCSVVADNNRRQGLSITSVNGMSVKDSVFKNTNGTAPEAGLDIEPNAKELVTNVQIRNSQFLNNFGGGFVIAGKSSDGSESSRITASGNTVIGNGVNRHAGILLSHALNTVVEDNVIKNNLRQGVDLEDGTAQSTVAKNTITDNRGFGIEMYEVNDNFVNANTISHNGNYAVKVFNASSNIITNNVGENNNFGGVEESPGGTNTIKDNNFN